MGTRFDDYVAESAATDTEAGRQMSAAFSAHYDAVHEAQFMATELTSEEIEEVFEQNADVVDRISSGDPHALASLFAAAGVTVTATKVFVGFRD